MSYYVKTNVKAVNADVKAGPQSPDGRAPSEVTTRGSARGHFTRALYEVVNLAPFVTSFSARLMAS